MANTDIGRLVGLVPTYREGPLAAAAIRSLLPHVDTVITAEGPVGDAPEEGYETDLREFRKNPRVMQLHGHWQTEVGKRNEMLARTRRLPKPTWGVYLDADEILIGGEYVRDLIWAAQVNAQDGHDVTAIPIPITEVDSSVGKVTRLIRLDALEGHVLSMSQLKFFGQTVVATFPLLPVWRPGEKWDEYNRPPMQGEPHIHHRAYYRPPKRGEYRLHASEVEEFQRMEKDALESLGLTGVPAAHIPVLQDPGFIVARETDESEQPKQATPDPFDNYLRGGGDY